MTPVVTADGIDLSPGVLGPILGVVVLVVVIALLVHKGVFGAGDALADLWRTYGPVARRRTLDHRPGLKALPWFCDRCHSYNGVSATRCYKCDARREEAEAILEGELPAGPSAGLTQRTRPKG